MTGQNTFEGDKTKRNARSLQLTHIQYRADKSLVKEANRRCKLECAGESRLCQSAYTKEERLKLALEFLEKRGGLSQSAATKDLCNSYGRYVAHKTVSATTIL